MASDPQQDGCQREPRDPIQDLVPERTEPVDRLVAHDVSQSVLRHEDEARGAPDPDPAQRMPRPGSAEA